MASDPRTATAGTSLAPARPTSWLVLGILDIVFGAMGLLIGLWSIVMVYAPPAFMRAANENNAAANDPHMLAWNHLAMPVYLALSLWQLVLGIRLIAFHAGARRQALWMSGAEILYKAANTIVVLLYLPAVMREAMNHDPNAAKLGISGMMGGIAVASAVLSLLFTLPLPVVHLFLLRRDPFAATAAAPAGDGPREADDGGNPYRAPER